MGPTGGLSAYPSDSTGSVLKTESQFHLSLIAKQAIFYLTVSEKQDLALQLDSALIQGWDGHTESPACRQNQQIEKIWLNR